MGRKEVRAGRTGRRYHFEFSRTSIFLWSAGAFVLLAWIFTLGVLAGKGLLPLPGGVTTLAELKVQISKLQQMISKKDRSELERIRELQRDPEFAFFDELSGKNGNEVEKPSSSPKRGKKDFRDNEESGSAKALTKYIVQVASLDSEAKATEMVNRLIGKGYPTYYYKVFIKGRRYYRVRCGMFKTKEEAIHIKKRLAKNEKLDGLVRKVKRE